MKFRISKNISSELKNDDRSTIMIVDDESNHLKELVKLFSGDYNIITALNAQEALKKLQGCEHPEEISLIICDQCMPGMTGVKLFKELANNQIMPDTVRIILTAHDEKEVMREGINEAHIFKFVLKPYNPDELRLIVRDAVESFYRQELKQCRYDIDERDIEIAKLKKELENLKVKYNALSQK